MNGDLNIIVAGAAGQGMQTIGLVLGIMLDWTTFTSKPASCNEEDSFSLANFTRVVAVLSVAIMTFSAALAEVCATIKIIIAPKYSLQ